MTAPDATVETSRQHDAEGESDVVLRAPREQVRTAVTGRRAAVILWPLLLS